MSDPLKADRERSVALDTLVCAIGAADAETLLELRQLFIGAMYPSMPASVRQVVLPLFALVTLEARSIEQGLWRLGEKREQPDADRKVWRDRQDRLRPTEAG